MSLSRADLFFDQIEVVEQPFPGRRNPAVCLDGLGQQVADSKQDTFIFSQPRQKLVPRASRAQLVRTRQGLAMLLHLIGAEQLGSQRRLAAAYFRAAPFPPRRALKRSNVWRMLLMLTSIYFSLLTFLTIFFLRNSRVPGSASRFARSSSTPLTLPLLFPAFIVRSILSNIL